MYNESVYFFRVIQSSVTMNTRVLLLLLCCVSLPGVVIFTMFSAVHAQSSIAENITITYPIQAEYSSGDIIVRDRESNVLRPVERPDASNMFGVVAEQPLVVFQIDEESVPVVRSGQAEVNVVAEGGVISVGDPITSSSIPGHGKKAGSDDLYQVGVALESFGEDGIEAGSILIDINIGRINPFIDEERVQEDDDEETVAPMTLFESLRLDIIARYFIAALIAIGSILGSFRYFGANLAAGVTSVGRNPMAKNSIRRLMFMNILAIVLISLGGVALSIFVLILPIPSVY